MKPKWLQALRPRRSSRSPSPASETRQETPPRPALSQSGPSVSTPSSITVEPQAPPAVPAPETPIRTRLWNGAYDKVKEDEPRLVEAYEKILSAQLGDDNPAPLEGGTANVIKQDADTRQDQMKQLVDKGLGKTEREAKVKEKIKKGMQPIKNIKDFVALAAKTEPTAAVAWVGITTCMEIITNPVTEPGINRDGIKHVLETVQWYWELADLLDADGADESTIKLQELLEKHIVSLYKKLLMYQMQSVCLYNKHWAAVLVRDLVKIDDWQEKIDSIKKAEEAIREKIKQKNSEVLKSRLACIDDKLGHLRLDVQAVTSAVGGVESAVNEQTRGLLKMHHDDQDNECLRDLCIINPKTHKQRLEKTKGGLLEDSYRWILDHDDFREFRDLPDRRLLWIKGDPGKGKTMLLCGIIEELEKESDQPLSYFFCQATQDHLRSAISVLRGLVWLFCKKHPELMPCVREAYDMEGKKCFGDFFSLKVILECMLQKPCLQNAILIVDALDECSYQREDVEREELIGLIIELSESFSAKWIVSSRNWPVIEGQFRPADKIAVSLELNKDAISKAVETFVRYKTDELARIKPLDEQTKEDVLRRLLVGANDTFLWVALVCKELARPVVKPWETLAKLDHIHTGLDDLYKRMLEQIITSDYSELYRQILAVVCVAYRPLSLDELRTFVPELQAYGSEALSDFIAECGSFLVIQNDFIHFVHQSARDFLVGSGKDTVFPSGIRKQHSLLLGRSLGALEALGRDMYGLKSPGVVVEDITPPDPDPLSPLKYATLYWIDHLGQFSGCRQTCDDEAVYRFLRKKYLYWLEALSLQHWVEQGLEKTLRLKSLIRDSKVEGLYSLVEDAWRFVSSHFEMIMEAPLQLYVSALVFSPTRSLMRQLFSHEEPSWLAIKLRQESCWSSCVLRLHRPSDFFHLENVAISPDGKLLARLESDTVQIFNLGWTRYTHSVKLDAWATRVKFAPDGERLAVGSERGVIELLDAKLGQPIREFRGHEDDVNALAFSPDGNLLASASLEEMILWDPNTSRRLLTLDCGGPVCSISFSADSQQLASGAFQEIAVWDASTGDCIWRIRAHGDSVTSVAFISGNVMVSGSLDGMAKIWDLDARTCTKELLTFAVLPSVVSLQDGSRFAHFLGPLDSQLNVCNERGECLQIIKVDSDSEKLEFLPGPRLLATTSLQGLKLWDLESNPPEDILQESNEGFKELVLSDDGKYLASSSERNTVRLWNISTGAFEQTLEDLPADTYTVKFLAFSDDGQCLISLCDNRYNRSVLVWDVRSGKYLGKYQHYLPASLSPDGQRLALTSTGKVFTIWDLSTSTCIQKLETDAVGCPYLVGVSRLVLVAKNTVEVWDIAQSRCIAHLESSKNWLESIKGILLSNDSNLLVLWSREVGEVWNLVTKNMLHGFLSHGFLSRAQPLKITPDKEFMVGFSGVGKTLDIMKLQTGIVLCRIQLPGRMGPSPWRFDSDDQFRLHTEWGVIDLADSFRGLDAEIEVSWYEPRRSPRYFGYGLSGEGAWILHGSKRILWIPSQYRAKVVVAGPTVAVEDELGQVSLIQFVEDGRSEEWE